MLHSGDAPYKNIQVLRGTMNRKYSATQRKSNTGKFSIKAKPCHGENMKGGINTTNRPTQILKNSNPTTRAGANK